jgi:HSP20 family protein
MVSSLLRYPGDVFADFDDLHRQLDRLLGARSASGSIRAQHGSFPAVNVGATPEAVEIYAFAPGIDTGSLDVTVDKGLLTIAGQRKSESGDAGAKRNVYASERPQGAFRRVISLPEDADPDRVQASYTNGVLKVRVEKRETSRPRRIEVKDAQ